MGGEKNFSFCISNLTRGSPPHGRGKAPFKRGLFHILGITPAWAGKSQLLPCCGLWSLDHPRMGGEKWALSPRHWVILGSPPHGRGKGVLIFPRRAAVGITPAWAGKRRRAGGGTPARQDHPRVGGEKKMYRTAGACFSGSPPRGRGKVAVDHFLHSAAGITPAWAGKRAFFHDSGRMPRDHPRVGGEKTKKIP